MTATITPAAHVQAIGVTKDARRSALADYQSAIVVTQRTSGLVKAFASSIEPYRKVPRVPHPGHGPQDVGWVSGTAALLATVPVTAGLHAALTSVVPQAGVGGFAACVVVGMIACFGGAGAITGNAHGEYQEAMDAHYESERKRSEAPKNLLSASQLGPLRQLAKTSGVVIKECVDAELHQFAAKADYNADKDARRFIGEYAHGKHEPSSPAVFLGWLAAQDEPFSACNGRPHSRVWEAVRALKDDPDYDRIAEAFERALAPKVKSAKVDRDDAKRLLAIVKTRGKISWG